MSGWVVVDLCYFDVVLVMVWSVCWFGVMYKGVRLHAYSLYVKVGDVKDFMFGHEWFCVCSWWFI